MPKISAAPATPAVRRCELPNCNKRLSIYNKGRYCSHHRQEEIEKFLLDNPANESSISTAEDVLKAVSTVWKVNREILSKSQASRKYSSNDFEARRAAMYLLRKDLNLHLAPIAEIVGLSQGPKIGSYIKRVEGNLSIDQDLRRRVAATRALCAQKAPV